jgi:phage/plasmid-like protein (TIGR03299 family)
MSHEVETMFSVGSTPWHGLGTVLNAETVLSSREAIVASGLDWRAETRSLGFHDAAGTWIPSGANAVVRSTDGRILCSHIGESYQPLQNEDAFAFFDAYVMRGDATYETAGSLRGGSVVWVLAKLDNGTFDVTKGDAVESYVLLSNSHDGTTAVRAGFTPTRVVCANTLAMAHAQGRQSLHSARHTSGMMGNLGAIGDAIASARQAFASTADAYRFLASKQVRAADITTFVSNVFATTDTANAQAKRASKAQAKAVAAMPVGVLGLAPAGGFAANDASESGARVLPVITRLFESGRGNAGGGSYWHLYNALTEFLQYERRGTAESRLESLSFGNGASQSRRGLEYAMRMAQAA